MNKFAAVGLAIIVFAAPAYAQTSLGGKSKSPTEIQDEINVRQAKELDKQYNTTIKKTGTAASGVVDPWQNARTPTPPSDKK